jgi:hypothetical protein
MRIPIRCDTGTGGTAMRNTKSKLSLAVVTTALTLIGGAQAAGTSGPVMPVPHQTFVAPLACSNKVVAYGRSIDVTNTANTTLAKGKVISWSYRFTGAPGGQNWPTPPGGRVKTGTTTLKTSLAAGQALRIDLINKGYAVSDCKASVTL